jgi:hypothetical protein
LLSARTGSEFLTPRAFAILYKFVKCFSLSHLSNKKTVSISFFFLLSHFSSWPAGIQKSISAVRLAIDFLADLQMHGLQLFDRMSV